MKRQYISFRQKGMILAVSAMTLLGVSCSKSFLNQQPQDATNTSTAITSESSMYTALVGLYSSLRATDFYGRSYAIKGDLMSDDCFLSSSNSGRYLGFNNYDMDKTNSYPSAIWQNAYAAVKNADLIINSGLAINGTATISQMYAEAYAIRGMIYFDLVRNFALPYAEGANNPGVPIVLKFDSLALPARNTVGEVYAQVLSDLDSAALLVQYTQGSTMTFSTTGVNRVMYSSYVSKYTISGLLARVYQNMENWTAAQTAALDVVNNGGYSLAASTSLQSYWMITTLVADKVETMFEVTSDANNSVSDGTLANIYVPKTAGGSYGDILATKAFYSMYSTTDARRSLFNPTTRSGQLGTAYYVTKYPIDNNNFDDVKIMRYPEMLLILAEAYYNLGDEANALLYLNKVAMARDAGNTTGYTSTGEQVLEDILTEREKEFAFEGYRFWDLYRLQRTFVKPQAQDASNAITKSVSVTPTTTNLIFPIPNDEILINPNLTQNSGY